MVVEGRGDELSASSVPGGEGRSCAGGANGMMGGGGGGGTIGGGVGGGAACWRSYPDFLCLPRLDFFASLLIPMRAMSSSNTSIDSAVRCGGGGGWGMAVEGRGDDEVSASSVSRGEGGFCAGVGVDGGAGGMMGGGGGGGTIGGGIGGGSLRPVASATVPALSPGVDVDGAWMWMGRLPRACPMIQVGWAQGLASEVAMVGGGGWQAVVDDSDDSGGGVGGRWWAVLL